MLLNAGGTPDYYSMPLPFRGDGMVRSTGASASERPEQSNLRGLFIDTKEKVTLWP